jgi:hypothetical protein
VAVIWKTVLDTRADQIVRGNWARALRTIGAAGVVAEAFLVLALWLVVKDSFETKVAVAFAGALVMSVIVLFAAAMAAFTVAEVRSGRLNFSFCGMPTRSFGLNEGTTFEVRTLGRLEVLTITCERTSYVPNGLLDKSDLVELLRANGVAETNAG